MAWPPTTHQDVQDVLTEMIGDGAVWHTVGDPDEPAYENGWAPASGFAVKFKKSGGFLSITAGTLTIPASGAATAIFYLPTTHRPAADFLNNFAWQNASPRLAGVNIFAATGEVRWVNFGNTGGTATAFTAVIPIS